MIHVKDIQTDNSTECNVLNNVPVHDSLSICTICCTVLCILTFHLCELFIALGYSSASDSTCNNGRLLTPPMFLIVAGVIGVINILYWLVVILFKSTWSTDTVSALRYFYYIVMVFSCCWR